MHFVDEQDAVAGVLDFLDDLFQPFLELPPVLGAGHQSAHIQGDQAFALQGFRDFAAVNLLGQGFHDGRFAHARLAHQHRIILGAAAEDLHHPLQFLLAADDRIQLAIPGGFSQVDAQLIQSGSALAGAGALGARRRRRSC